MDDAHTKDDSHNGRERSKVQTGENNTKDTGKQDATETMQETPRKTLPPSLPNFGKSQFSKWWGRFTTALPTAKSEKMPHKRDTTLGTVAQLRRTSLSTFVHWDVRARSMQERVGSIASFLVSHQSQL